MIDHGRHDDFHWLWAPKGSVAALLSACPGLVRRRPVLVTDFHGAPPSPRPKERAKGWRGLTGAAFHPCLPEAEDLIWDDICEVYVLTERAEPSVPPSRFNDGLFTLRNPEDAIPFEKTWDRRGIEQRRGELLARQTEFWDVMKGLPAHGYLGLGDYSGFIFATCQQDHFSVVLRALGPGA